MMLPGEGWGTPMGFSPEGLSALEGRLQALVGQWMEMLWGFLPLPCAPFALHLREALMVGMADEPSSDVSVPPLLLPQEIPLPPAKAEMEASEVAHLVARAAQEQGVDSALALAVAKVESNFHPHALSPKGAVGVMQLMPETAKALGVADPWEPWANIQGGVRYLKQLLEQFGGRVELAVAAYNAGPSAVRRFGGIPPFPETQTYVRKVLEQWEAYRTSEGVPTLKPSGLPKQISLSPSPPWVTRLVMEVPKKEGGTAVQVRVSLASLEGRREVEVRVRAAEEGIAAALGAAEPLLRQRFEEHGLVLSRFIVADGFPGETPRERPPFPPRRSVRPSTPTSKGEGFWA